MVHVAFEDRISHLHGRVPVIMSGEVEYDPHVNRFLRELPSNGARSPHSARGYAYDICLWARFLQDGYGAHVWDAQYAHLKAFHLERRDGSPFACSETTWNRCVAALDKLYQWALDEELIEEVPFRYRRARSPYRRGAEPGLRNRAYEDLPTEHIDRSVTPEAYAVFRDVGLRGGIAPGVQERISRHRNGARNAAFANLLVTSGLRLEESSTITIFEWRYGPHRSGLAANAFFRLGKSATKGQKKRKTLIPHRVLREVDAYVEIERSLAISKGASRRVWEEIDSPVFVREHETNGLELKVGDNWRIVDRDKLTPDQRLRLVECNQSGQPIGSALLWLTEVGLPVKPNTWDVTFRRAAERCAKFGLDFEVTPHTLRHTFACHIEPAIAKMFARIQEETGLVQGSPVRHVQHLLGHSRAETTERYYLPTAGSDELTVDEHVEAFFNEFLGKADEGVR